MTTSTLRADAWLIRLIVSKGLVAESDAALLSNGSAPFVSQEILARKLLSQRQLADAVEGQYGIAFAEPDAGALDKMAVSLVPEAVCRRHMMCPLKLRGESIELLMANPIDAQAIDSVAALTGRRVIPVFGLPEKIEEILAIGHGSDAAIFDVLKKIPEEANVECVEDAAVEEQANKRTGDIGAPVMRLANLVIAQAVRLKASDIHIEHDDKFTRIRYRIDGHLRNMMKVPKSVGEGPLISRIKIMANLDISDRRRPQDGRAKLLVNREEIGLRVSTMPTSFGEKAVLRILDRRQAEVPLESLGYRPEIMARLTALSLSSQGMLLITGPTGSGKTTTLYSVLHRIKAEDINITTVEDPIEYRLDGINQIQVNEKAGMTFASVLRSVLRQDPDVVLVGEIRDRETADIAFQAALTGHLVFSTLHTNNAVATISRLLDMGVERFKMAPALIGVASQRLVRRVCAACRVEIPADPSLAVTLKDAGLPVRQFKGVGCEGCLFTGLKGRIALTELLDLSEQAARDLLSAGSGERVLREEALKRGWLHTLSQDALWHIAHGDVTFEEAAAYFDPPLTAEPAAAPARATARRVLIVDDVQDNRELLRATLATEGYELADADGGAAALEEIARRKPDLILLDLMMPEIDGFAVVKRLRGDMGLTDLPILVITAMSESESQALALGLGADDYMTKPFNPKVLRARIKALFRRSEYAAASR